MLKLVLIAAVILFAVAIVQVIVWALKDRRAMAAEAASRTLAEVGRGRPRVTAAGVSLPGKGSAATLSMRHGSVTVAA